MPKLISGTSGHRSTTLNANFDILDISSRISLEVAPAGFKVRPITSGTNLQTCRYWPTLSFIVAIISFPTRQPRGVSTAKCAAHYTITNSYRLALAAALISPAFSYDVVSSAIVACTQVCSQTVPTHTQTDRQATL